MTLRSGLILCAGTQNAWRRLLAQHTEETSIRLSKPFALHLCSGKEKHAEIIPAGTELWLFCNMRGSYKQPSARLACRTLATFFLEDGRQISMLSTMRVRVVVPEASTVTHTERHHVATGARS